MLQNEPSVAKIGVDTAENEPIFGWIQLVQLSRFNSSILSLVPVLPPSAIFRLISDRIPPEESRKISLQHFKVLGSAVLFMLTLMAFKVEQ